MNGSTSPFFHPGRGLRQGCHVAPLLFLLVVEGLSRVISATKDGGSFCGINMGGNLYVSPLFFVENILIFFNGSKRDSTKLKDILSFFCSATSMLINDSKSSISYMNLDVQTMV